MRELALAKARQEQELDRDIRLAWWTVRLYAEFRTKRLPSLQQALARSSPPPVVAQTLTEQRAMLDRFSKMYGGKVRPVTHG